MIPEVLGRRDGGSPRGIDPAFKLKQLGELTMHDVKTNARWQAIPQTVRNQEFAKMTFIAMSYRHLRAYFAAILIGSVCVLGVPQARSTPMAISSIPGADDAGGNGPQFIQRDGLGHRARQDMLRLATDGMPSTVRTEDYFYKHDITGYVNKYFATEAVVLGWGASQD